MSTLATNIYSYTFIILFLVFVFTCYVLINRALKLKVFWMTMIFWLFPVFVSYVFDGVLSGEHSKLEPCSMIARSGFHFGFGNCDNHILPTIGFMWFILYAIIMAIILNAKLKKGSL